MHIIEHDFVAPFALPLICKPYFEGCRLAAFDIETTGLSSEKHAVILIGVLNCTPEGCRITQYFAEDPREEPAVLQAFLSFCQSCDVLFNYNGSSFDLPFLDRRAEKFGFSPIPGCKSFDLYRIIKQSCLACVLPDLKLKTVEKLAGIQRNDQISGKDSVSLYKKYTVSRDQTLGKQILLHNYEDVFSFTSFGKLARKIDIHQGFSRYGFPVKAGTAVFYIQKLTFHPTRIFAQGNILGAYSDQSYYLEEMTLLVSTKTSGFELTLFADRDPFPPDPRQINRLVINALKRFSF